jgi:hypothetical protein
MKTRLLACAAALAAAVTTAAHADTLTYNSYGVNYGDNITITSPSVPDTNVIAGQVQLYENGALVADAWCMDIFNDLLSADTYTTLGFNATNANTGYVSGPLPGVKTTMTDTQLDEIGWLVNEGNSLLSQGGSNVNDESAAIQIAIWSVENSSFNWTGGPSSSMVTDFVSDALAAGGSEAGIEFLVDAPATPNQTLITTTPVPEPSTWAMMALGFAGLGFTAFRRSRKGDISIVPA